MSISHWNCGVDHAKRKQIESCKDGKTEIVVLAVYSPCLGYGPRLLVAETARRSKVLE